MMVEVCANSLQSALNAQKAGATRIELCTELGVGGITPSFGLLQQVRDFIDIPVRVLIRPRSGNFTYSEAEFKCMLADIGQCRAMGFEGVVSGILHADNTLDIVRAQELVSAAKGMSFTFHRAFDWVVDQLEALRQLETLGVDTLLSSGGAKMAVAGMEVLLQCKEAASTITVMPGGGINPENAGLFKQNGFSTIHLSGAAHQQILDVEPKFSMASDTPPSDIAVPHSDYGTIKKVVDAVK